MLVDQTACFVLLNNILTLGTIVGIIYENAKLFNDSSSEQSDIGKLVKNFSFFGGSKKINKLIFT